MASSYLLSVCTPSVSRPFWKWAVHEGAAIVTRITKMTLTVRC